MYIIKNAVKNLGRYKVRYIMIAAIMLAIILTTSISLIINSTTASIIDSYKDQFGAEVSVTLDYEKLRENPTQTFQQVNAKDWIAYGDSKLLLSKEYDSNLQANANQKSVGEISEEEQQKRDQEMGRNSYPDPEGLILPNVSVISTTKKTISQDFESGARKITSGKIYKEKNDCLISEEYAKLNNLKVGDTIKLEIGDATVNFKEELKISGIYADNTDTSKEGDKMGGMPVMMKRANEILTSFDTVSEFGMLHDYGTVQPTFQLKNPDDLVTFEKELVEKGLPDFYKVNTDEDSYNAIVKPVEGLSDITMTFVYVVLGLGGIVLAIIFSMAIRERKYEIGVLRAMGMKKLSLAFGLICEVFLITVVTLGIGLGVASMAAQPVADYLLEGQIAAVEDTQQNNNNEMEGMMVIGEEKEKQEPLSEINVELEADAILKIVLIAFALGLLSSSISIFYITKYEPMKILAERN